MPAGMLWSVVVIRDGAAGQGVRAGGAIAGCDRAAAGGALHVVSGSRTGSGSCKVSGAEWR